MIDNSHGLAYYLAMPWATDAALLTFAWIGFLLTVGTLATLTVIGARTVIRSRRLARRAVASQRLTVSRFPGL